MAVEPLSYSHPPDPPPTPRALGPGANVGMVQGERGRWHLWHKLLFGHSFRRLNAQIGLVCALMESTCKAVYVLHQ